MDLTIVGRGWSWDLQTASQKMQPNERGQIISLTNERNEIEQAIHIILLTIPGERVMRPTFGCRIHDLVFEPNNGETAVQAERYVAQALGMWEPRIDVTKVTATPNNNRLLVSITYTIRATNDERNLVYPFYLIPGE